MNVEERLKILDKINELLGRQKSFSRFSTKEEGREFARLCALIEDDDYLLSEDFSGNCISFSLFTRKNREEFSPKHLSLLEKFNSSKELIKFFKSEELSLEETTRVNFFLPSLKEEEREMNCVVSWNYNSQEFEIFEKWSNKQL